jgi:hypothetical protein
MVVLATVVVDMIQVLSFTGDNHAGSDGPIAIYEFATVPSVCYTELRGGKDRGTLPRWRT